MRVRERMLRVSECLSSFTTFAVLALSPHISSAEPTVFPRGVTIHDPSAYATDILFSGLQHTYLINMDGKVLHSWDYQGEPAEIVDPKFFGGVKGVVGLQIVEARSEEMPNLIGVGLMPDAKRNGFINKTFGFVDWNGKTLWQWSGPPGVGAALQNHDWGRLENGDTLIHSDEVRSFPIFGDRKIINDVIYEVSPAGKIVWQWSATDHIQQFGFTQTQLRLVVGSANPDYLHMNAMHPLGPNRLADAGDARFAPDNIIISSRNANFIAIIDHKSGDIVWRIGPDFPPLHLRQPGHLPRAIDQISGQHDAHMIPEGLPGAGDILIFDNQGQAGYPPAVRSDVGGSRALEISPLTKEIVWEYVGSMSGGKNFSFYSPYISSLQRLPNGNTLIDEGIDERIFQVTPSGKIVWEYIAPLWDKVSNPKLDQLLKTNGSIVYRAQAVPLDWVP